MASVSYATFLISLLVFTCTHYNRYFGNGSITVDLGVFFTSVHVYSQVLDHSPLAATAFGLIGVAFLGMMLGDIFDWIRGKV